MKAIKLLHKLNDEVEQLEDKYESSLNYIYALRSQIVTLLQL